MLNPLIDTESIPVSNEPVSQVPGRVLPYRYLSSAAFSAVHYLILPDSFHTGWRSED